MFRKIPILKQIITFFRSADIPLPFKAVSLFIYLLYVVYPMDVIPDIFGLFFGTGYIDDVVFAGVFFEAMRRLWHFLKR